MDNTYVGQYYYDATQTNFIGSGAQGSVYRCQQRNNNEPLCIKNDMRNLQRTELQVGLELLNHQNQNLVKLYDLLEMNNKIYIIMEKCEINLEKIKQNLQLAPYQAICIIQQIVDGYRTLYERNIKHRDIKPTNILFSQNGFKISDLGVAKILGTASSTNSAKGTEPFMSPQVANNCFKTGTNVDYTNKTDIFSVIYQYYAAGDDVLLFSFLKFSILGLPNLEDRCLSFLQNQQHLMRLNWVLKFPNFLKKCCSLEKTIQSVGRELFQHPLIHEARLWSPLLNQQIYYWLQISARGSPQFGIQQDSNDQINSSIPNSQISQQTLQSQNQHYSNQQNPDISQQTFQRPPTNFQESFIGSVQSTMLIGQVQQYPSNQSTVYQNQQFQQ